MEDALDEKAVTYLIAAITEDEATHAALQAIISRRFLYKGIVGTANLTGITKVYPPKMRVSYPKSQFSIDKMPDTWCLSYLRFTSAQVHELSHLLQIPTNFRYRFRASPSTALAVVLYRLSSPQRLKDAIVTFGHGYSWLSTIFNDVCEHLYNTFKDKLFWDETRLTPTTLTRYCNTIFRHGEPSGRIWGFIDGTHREICRPGPDVADQTWFYSGYKKKHTIQSQAVATPDGLISSFCGGFEGRTSDWGMWLNSELGSKLEAHAFNDRGESLYIYGDAAYGLQPNVIGSIKAMPGRELTQMEKTFNNCMSRQRIIVEWAFGKVNQYFGYVDYNKGMKIGLSPVGAYYFVAVLLTNCHTCYNGSNASQYFQCPPPSIEEYLS